MTCPVLQPSQEDPVCKAISQVHGEHKEQDENHGDWQWPTLATRHSAELPATGGKFPKLRDDEIPWSDTFNAVIGIDAGFL